MAVSFKTPTFPLLQPEIILAWPVIHMLQAHQPLSSRRVLTDAWVHRHVRARQTGICMCWQTLKKEITLQLDYFHNGCWNHCMECVCVCMFIVSKEGTLQLKPFRGALSAWIGPETLFFIREFAVDNRSWLPTAEQQFCSLRKWEGERAMKDRDGGERRRERNCTGHSFALWKSLHWSQCLCLYGSCM